MLEACVEFFISADNSVVSLGTPSWDKHTKHASLSASVVVTVFHVKCDLEILPLH